METGNEFVFKAAEIREKGGLKASAALPAEACAGLVDKPGAVRSASVELDFSLDDEGIILEGRVTAELDLECARCGGMFTARLSDTFDEAYEDSVESIDVRGTALDAVALLPPMKPLCSPDCKGLCPVCRCDLNKKICGCKPEAGDAGKTGGANPFQALERLKGKKDDKKRPI